MERRSRQRLLCSTSALTDFRGAAQQCEEQVGPPNPTNVADFGPIEAPKSKVVAEGYNYAAELLPE